MARTQEAFWRYQDIALFVALTLPAMLLGHLLVLGFTQLIRLRPETRAEMLISSQFTGYGLLLLALYGIIRVQYRRPFWESLGWVRPEESLGILALQGIGLALAVAMVGALLQTPDIETPMRELLADRRSVVLVGIFAVTLGPFFEELAFRGFLQPLLVRSLGTAPGILLAALPFGLLHLQQYAFSWRHGLLVTLAGMAFGWIRHRTGSTMAATAAHAAYNLTFFISLLTQWRHLPNAW
ncbi:MAG: type II CAAX endopeptidase family protein [Bryobacteraceae bacterium]